MAISTSTPPVGGDGVAEPPRASSYVSAPLEALNVAVIACGIIVFAWLLGRLPEEVPVHWNLAGEIDRWASPSTHWAMLGILIFDTLLMWGMIAMIARERWALPPADRQRYLGLQHRRRVQMVRLMEWMITGINTGFVILWLLIAASGLPDRGDLATTGIMVALLVMVAAAIVPIVVYWPRMREVARGIRAITGTEVLGTREDGWRWGGWVYYAPEDPAVVVPKKIGIGQTFNMARPAAWLFLAVMIGLPIILTGLLIAFVE